MPLPSPCVSNFTRTTYPRALWGMTPISQLPRPTLPDIGGLGPQQEAILTQLIPGMLSKLFGKSLFGKSQATTAASLSRSGAMLASLVSRQDFTKLQLEHKKGILELECKVRLAVKYVSCLLIVCGNQCCAPHCSSGN